MSIDEIMDLWSKDTKIDDIELDKACLDIPSLHSKYLKLLYTSKLKLRSLKLKQKELNRTLSEYYRGDLNNPDDLDLIQREPWVKAVLKQDLTTYVESDREMIELVTKIAYHEEMVDLLSEIIKAINNRGFQIKSAIDWRKLTQFGV